MPAPLPPPDEFAASLARAQAVGRRITPFEAGGRRYWLKRVERYESLLKRLIKGEAQAIFERERRVLRHLAEREVPVPAIVAEGPDWIVIEDCGPTLDDMARQSGYDPAAGLVAFAAAGHALAALHARGLTHGRGKIKDFCWDGSRIRFIDFEAEPAPFDPETSGRDDFVNFVLNCHFVGFHTGRDLAAELRAFLRAYRAGAEPGVLVAARRWARRRWWMVIPGAPIAWLTADRRAPDFKAIAPSLVFLAYHLDA